MKRRFLCLLFCAALLPLQAVPAAAGDHRMPDTKTSAVPARYTAAYLTRQDAPTGLPDPDQDGCISGLDLVLQKRALLEPTAGISRTIRVDSTEALRDALAAAQAGDEILLAADTVFTWSQTGKKGSLFYSAAEGTAEHPIVLRSEDAMRPAVLQGTDPAVGLALYITGDYWKISGITVGCAQKGIVLDHASHCVIHACKVENTGSEGIHLRDDSADCIVSDCIVTRTGQVTPGYGEAIYIGSAKSTTGYGYDCSRNLITGCTLGPEVTAELVDIKEYTTDNVIAYCTMDGADIKGEVSATSLVNAKGNRARIHHNACYRNGNAIVRNAFEVHCQVEGWGEENTFSKNLCWLDASDAYILRVYSGSALTSGNQRFPAGNLEKASGGTLTQLP